MSLPTSELVSAGTVKGPDLGARRTRLREFQAQLVERMHAARSSALPHTSQLGVMSGQNRLLLNLQEAGEIASAGAITKVPLAQDWFLGVTNIRGNLTTVIDLARFCGQPATPVDKNSRIVVFSPALSFNSGLLVSRVLGLRNIAEMQSQPDTESRAAPWLARRYADHESQVWTELNLSLLVQDPRFLHVGL